MSINAGRPRGAKLAVGAVLLVVGAFPWLYTPHFTAGHPRGGDPQSGMLGTLIFLFVGLPGLMVVCSVWKRTPGKGPVPQGDSGPA